MRLTSKQDIDAPIALVFKALTDFDHWERAALRRGAEVGRTDSLTKLGPGMAWFARFAFRGKTRELDLNVTKVTAPTQIKFAAQARVVTGDIQIELVEMSAKRTRILATAEIKPVTLGARLFLQSLRLARARVDKKFDQRVAIFASEIKVRANAGQATR
ncbi:MAG: hypothetical protein RIR95_857 [Pseudomonadota bacterium]